MLVLSRRVYETLLIGNDIKVTVLGIKGGQVRLGIAAPTEIPIRRENFFQLSKAAAHDSEKT
jgi:carbon storage regulator